MTAPIASKLTQCSFSTWQTRWCLSCAPSTISLWLTSGNWTVRRERQMRWTLRRLPRRDHLNHPPTLANYMSAENEIMTLQTRWWSSQRWSGCRRLWTKAYHSTLAEWSRSESTQYRPLTTTNHLTSLLGSIEEADVNVCSYWRWCGTLVPPR